MSQKPSSILVISNDDEIQEIIGSSLEEQKYRVIEARNSNEARLKYGNEDFQIVIIDLNLSGFKALDFVQGIRRKEDLKNIKDIKPILIVGDKPEVFTRDYCTVDQAKFLDYPFSKVEFKKKMFEFGVNSDVIASNSVVIKKDDYLITEGGNSHEMYWILSGTFIITKLNQDDKNVIIGEVHPGELVGEMSFLDNLPRSASVRAKEESEVLIIPHKKFINVMEDQPRWFRSLMQTLSQRLRSANQIIARKQASVDPSGDPSSEDIDVNHDV